MKASQFGAVLGTAALLLPVAAQAQDVEQVIAGLPQILADQYSGAPQDIHAAQAPAISAAGEPFLWCHSESYQGNPWRVSVTNELRRLVEGLIAEGKVTGFEIADSNNDVSQQINQIRGFIDKGCGVITSIPGSATALNDVIAAAHEAGIPFVTAAGSVTAPEAVNVDSNYARWGYDMMTAIAGLLGEDGGNVMLVEGIAGHPIVVQEREGGDLALSENPQLKVSRAVNGNWTANVTKTVVFQTLATNPSPIDAVWTTGSESRVVAEAFAEAGRDQPLITGSLTGDALGYWNEHQDSFRFEGHALLPGWTAQTLYRVAARVMEGQTPALNTLLIPIPPVHGDELANWYEPCMKPDSVSVFPVPPVDPMPEDLLDAYFTNPAPSPAWDYAAVPGACAE